MQPVFPSSDFDVIVVGGGPAGSTTARRLALSGLKVLVLEKACFPRYKSCGGAVTERVKELLDFDISPAVERTVRDVSFTYKGRAPWPVRGGGDLAISMVMRSEFDNLLLRKAGEAGASIIEGERVVGLEQASGGVTLKVQSGQSFKASVCVGADGATSAVARHSGLAPSEPLGIGLAAELRKPEGRLWLKDEALELDFGGVGCGYRWIFPKAEQYSIGVCTTESGGHDLKRLLNEYIVSSRLLRACDVILTKGHTLPFYIPGRRLQRGRVLLVGDAAGCVDPLTGEGILPAIESAIIAAQCVEAFLRYDIPLESYSERLTREVLNDFDYAERWADLFFSHPLIGYVAGIASRRMNRLLMNVLMGVGTYEEAYLALRPTITGRLGSRLIRWSYALRQLSAPVRAS